MHIAVIGAGLAGLTAAWLLSRQHQVTLYERQAQPGFTASAVTVPWQGQDVRVDVPLRVFYAGYYPTLLRLYEALGVESEAVSYAASFMGAQGRLYFRYRNLQRGGRSYSYPAAQNLLEPRAWRIVRGAVRFHREARAALARGELEGQTLGDYLARRPHNADFVDGLLLPAIATVCTCSYTRARAFPATVVVDYLDRGLSREPVRRARLGADDVAQRLLAGITTLRCNARIAAVQHTTQGVAVVMDDGSQALHEHVVFAAPAPQVRKLWCDAGAAEAAVLDGFAYAPIEVVMHADTRLMPARRPDWSPVNLMVAPEHDQPESTIWVNAVQPALREAPDVFQTVHPLRAPRDELVIGRARFERPVVDAGSVRSLMALQQLHREPGRRVWLCGSYAQAGVPLLESAVRSACDVARALGCPPLDAGSRYLPDRGISISGDGHEQT